MENTLQKCDEIISRINDGGFYALCLAEDEICMNTECVDGPCDIENHRWFSMATYYYRCSDGYVAVNGAYQSFSEGQDWSDIGEVCNAWKVVGKERESLEMRIKAAEIAKGESAPAPEQEQTEVAPGMTVEQITALFFDADALREPSYKVYQLNTEGHRYYYRFDEKGMPVFYPSVTTLLKQVMPTPPALIDWMIANGKDGSTEKRDLAASYGTFMHIQFERLLISRKYDFDECPAALLEFMEKNNLPEKFFGDSLPKIRKDVCAFAQFVKDYRVRPMAIEIGLVHPTCHYAGCIDLPCRMTDPKTGEEFAAIVDFKSGRKGFFEEHELQLHLYKAMWNVNFPDAPVTRVFNFAPKDWRKKPTYNLKDQTDSPNAQKLPHLLALAAIEDDKRDNTLTIVHGVIDLDKGDIMNNVTSCTLAELIKAKKGPKDAPGTETKDNGTETPRKSTKRATKRATNRTKDDETINSPSEPEKPVTSEIPEKLPWDKEQTVQAMAEQAAKVNLLDEEMEL